MCYIGYSRSERMTKVMKIKIPPPQLPDQPAIAENFRALALCCLDEERPLEGIRMAEQTIENDRFPKLEIRRSILEGCAFTGCDFTGTSFVDVAFFGCNFSNSRFADSYFSRCRFVGCKWVGADLNGAVLRQVTLENTNLRYSCFDRARLNDLLLTDCDFSEASLSEVRWKNIEGSDCRFVRTSFFKTPLAGFDFTSNELLAPLLSSPPTELRGAKVTLLQAAELAGLFGVIVER